MQPQQPEPQLQQPEPQQQPQQAPQPVATAPIVTAPIPAAQPLVVQKTSKNVGGTLLVIYASLTLLIGIASLLQSIVLGLIMLGLGAYWLVAGIKVLKNEPKKASKTLETASALTIGYAGILLFASIFLPGFQISGVILPAVFAIVLSIMSVRLKKQATSL